MSKKVKNCSRITIISVILVFFLAVGLTIVTGNHLSLSQSNNNLSSVTNCGLIDDKRVCITIPQGWIIKTYWNGNGFVANDQNGYHVAAIEIDSAKSKEDIDLVCNLKSNNTDMTMYRLIENFDTAEYFTTQDNIQLGIFQHEGQSKTTGGYGAIRVCYKSEDGIYRTKTPYGFIRGTSNKHIFENQSFGVTMLKSLKFDYPLY